MGIGQYYSLVHMEIYELPKHLFNVNKENIFGKFGIDEQIVLEFLLNPMVKIAALCNFKVSHTPQH